MPTLVLTLIHDEVFDFGRWQAVGWVGLFVTAPVSAAAMLGLKRVGAAGGRALRSGSRAMLAILALALGVVAVLVWTDATRDDVARIGPVDLVRLTGAYLGAWCSFLAVLSGWAGARGTWDDARVSLMTVAAAAGGALVAFLRSIADLRHPVATLLVSSGLLVAAVLIYGRNRTPPSESGHAGDGFGDETTNDPTPG